MRDWVPRLCIRGGAFSGPPPSDFCFLPGIDLNGAMPIFAFGGTAPPRPRSPPSQTGKEGETIMFGKTLLAATCIAVLTTTAFAGSGATPVQLADSAAPMKSAAATSTATHQDANMVRASEFIGETVYNGKGEKVGAVDDLILHRSDKVLYAVVSVGGFLGIGDKLVAVPFDQLKTGTKEVDGLIVYDITKEKLKAQPEFHYAVAGDDASRARFMRSAGRQLDRWQGRIEQNMSSAKDSAKEMKKSASKRVDDAWQKVKAEWKELQAASADAWDGAKRKFDDAMANLEQTWKDATS
jgi:sporulation protein YlmC with PRC-barrel domain